MESRARLFGHSIHQQLVAFPLGLLFTSVAFDVAASISGRANGFHIAYWLIAAGVVSGLVAAVFGLLDFMAIPGGTRARRVGRFHAIGNAVVLFMFGVS